MSELLGGNGTELVVTGAYAAAAVAAYLLFRVLLPVADRAARRSKFLWDDVIRHRKLRHRLSLLGPGLVFWLGVRFDLEAASGTLDVLSRVTSATLVFIAAATISALLDSINEVYETKPISRDRPIHAYVQIFQLLAYLFGMVIAVAILADRSPWLFVTGLGAFTAVILLIFKDTILALVASIQLAQNDLVDVGDWIEMPEFEADGPVTDIALHAVTVQNFDKTITTIPPYRMVTGSFRNWRGMHDSGLRRIKRTISIDMTSVRFLTEDEVERFSGFDPLVEYMDHKRRELDEANAEAPPAGVRPDARRLTNIGTFRAYLVEYLRRHPSIESSDATMLVRQRQPGEHGLPMEIYAFTKTTDWATFEAIQSDVFDHVLAMIPEFGLRVYQEPTGYDLKAGTVG